MICRGEDGAEARQLLPERRARGRASTHRLAPTSLPQATTTPRAGWPVSMNLRSIARKAASPSSAKTCATDFPVRRSISWSLSSARKAELRRDNPGRGRLPRAHETHQVEIDVHIGHDASEAPARTQCKTSVRAAPLLDQAKAKAQRCHHHQQQRRVDAPSRRRQRHHTDLWRQPLSIECVGQFHPRRIRGWFQ